MYAILSSIVSCWCPTEPNHTCWMSSAKIACLPWMIVVQAWFDFFFEMENYVNVWCISQLFTTFLCKKIMVNWLMMNVTKITRGWLSITFFSLWFIHLIRCNCKCSGVFLWYKTSTVLYVSFIRLHVSYLFFYYIGLIEKNAIFLWKKITSACNNLLFNAFWCFAIKLFSKFCNTSTFLRTSSDIKPWI